MNNDDGSCICILKDKNEQQWERPRQDSYIYYAEMQLTEVVRSHLKCERSGYICDQGILMWTI